MCGCVPPMVTHEKFLASAKSTADICREAGVLDGRLGGELTG